MIEEKEKERTEVLQWLGVLSNGLGKFNGIQAGFLGEKTQGDYVRKRGKNQGKGGYAQHDAGGETPGTGTKKKQDRPTALSQGSKQDNGGRMSEGNKRFAF